MSSTMKNRSWRGEIFPITHSTSSPPLLINKRRFVLARKTFFWPLKPTKGFSLFLVVSIADGQTHTIRCFLGQNGITFCWLAFTTTTNPSSLSVCTRFQILIERFSLFPSSNEHLKDETSRLDAIFKTIFIAQTWTCRDISLVRANSFSLFDFIAIPTFCLAPAESRSSTFPFPLRAVDRKNILAGFNQITPVNPFPLDRQTPDAREPNPRLSMSIKFVIFRPSVFRLSFVLLDLDELIAERNAKEKSSLSRRREGESRTLKCYARWDFCFKNCRAAHESTLRLVGGGTIQPARWRSNCFREERELLFSSS